MDEQGPLDPLLLDPTKTRTIGNYVIGILQFYSRKNTRERHIRQS